MSQTEQAEAKTGTVESHAVAKCIHEIEEIIAEIKPRLSGELTSRNRENIKRDLQHIRKAALAGTKTLA